MKNQTKKHESTAEYISRRILELKPRKSQAQIAAEAGYVNQNMITMIKKGDTKVAFDRVPALAKALECDPAFLMRLALVQSVGETRAAAIIEVFGAPVTNNERAWVEEIRVASEGNDPRMTNRSRKAIRAIFGK